PHSILNSQILSKEWYGLDCNSADSWDTAGGDSRGGPLDESGRCALGLVDHLVVLVDRGFLSRDLFFISRI
ncbi:MAG: hypothetical protein WCI73_06070, partial [Phycisphaerae bacterium]